jgi:putative PIN family toxin of toxin-antitoxin system
LPPLLVVIDTNILLDVYVFQDPDAAALLAHMNTGEILPVASAETNAEFAEVISRDKFGLSPQAQQAAISDWTQRASMKEASQVTRAPWRCKDKDDQKFLDLAFSIKPCVLISNDKQVLRFKKRAQREGVQIVASSKLCVASSDVV